MSKVKDGFSKLPAARALLTDTLPYEVPLYFTNFYLYGWAINKEGGSKLADLAMGPRNETIPHKFKIMKPSGGERQIAVIHPAVQVRVVHLYEKYDGFITNLCSKSSLSLRYPTRPASRYFDSRYRSNSHDAVAIDLDQVGFNRQTEFASSYFAYRHFPQVYKFFDSQVFLSLENKSNYLLRIDISKCFSSIYTHSISWAVRGKAFAKAMRKPGDRYFEAEFDKLMRDANWGETNGIVVGPEVSRIFCEILLQCVDVRVVDKLPSDVFVRRYMDDYFIFARDLGSASDTEKIISQELEEFNLYLNDAKRTVESSPLVTSLSICRLKVNDICAKVVEDLERSILSTSDDAHCSVSSARIIRDIRALAKQYSVSYSGLAAPALAVIARRLSVLVRSAHGRSIDTASVIRVQKEVSAIIGLAEFFYLSDVRCSTSNKMARIFLEIASFCDSVELTRSFFELQMLDIVRRAIAVWPECHIMDILNAVIAVQVIASDGRSLGCEDVNFVLSKKDGENSTEYLKIIAALFLSGTSKGLLPIRQGALRRGKAALMDLPSSGFDSAGVAMLALDFLSCPYVPLETKLEVYQNIYKRFIGKGGIGVKQAERDLKKMDQGLRFTNWSNDPKSLVMLRAILRKVEVRPAYD